MNRLTAFAVACVCTAGLGLAGPALARQAATPLTGSVGPGFTITLAKSGQKVKTLKAGSYKITVSDKSSSHDFHLIGPGVSKVITTVPFMGTKSITVTLKKGSYTYQCDPHAALGMKGSFKVS